MERIEKIADSLAATSGVGAVGAVTGWLQGFESFISIAAGIVAIIAGAFAIRYYILLNKKTAAEIAAATKKTRRKKKR